MESPLGFLAKQEGPLAMVLFLKVLCLFSTTRSFLILVPHEKMLTAEDLLLCHGQAQTVLLQYDLFLLGVFGRNSRGHHNDLGIRFSSALTKKPAIAVGEKLSAFFVLRSTGAATMSPWRSRIALKKELSQNSSQKSI